MTRPSATVEPRLRDQFGQAWPWPPLGSADGAEPPLGATAPQGAWLVFLPGAFTPVCTLELQWVDELADACAPTQTAVRVIAPDSAPVLRAVADQLSLTVPLLSDFWPHGAAAQRIGCFDAESGRPHRTSVLIDSAGAVVARVEGALSRPRTVQQHLEAMVSAQWSGVR
ncbi:redoxin domain-containing protein [Micrococcaceae sp. AOP34-BR2-30]